MAPASDARGALTSRDVPLEERLRQQKNGFASFVGGEARADGDESQAPSGGKKWAIAHRANKNRPMELTSKRAVGRFKQVVEVKKRRVLDPRFEAQSGRLNEDLFAKSYSFLDEYKQRELGELKRQLKIAKSTTRKEEIKHEISLRSQERSEKQKTEKIRDALTKRKCEEREAVASGKNPFYLKRKDKKKLELQAKFQNLQETGRLSKFMAKKRKKNASKDHRWLPTQRK
ncbi:hypothetical protein BBJ28_00006587 [Nothophytophthora sp. Chile5]|nr:hypothetical protein BBJ28_00006587 [Nothophytophthora sp. Chile5]